MKQPPQEPTRLNQIFEMRVERGLLETGSAARYAGFDFFAWRGTVFRFTEPPETGSDSTEAIGELAEWQKKLGGQPVEGRPSTDLEKSVPKLPPVTELLTNYEGEIVVCEDFYADPRAVRELALSKEFFTDASRHQGQRTPDEDIGKAARAAFEGITGPVGHGYTCFQLNRAGDKLVHHSDTQRWAAAVYLTENAPPEGGTSFYRSRGAKAVRSSAHLSELAIATGMTTGEAEKLVYEGNLLDRTKWQEVDRIGNVFNRLVIWDARLVHSVSECFGTGFETGRLVQLFFWDPA